MREWFRDKESLKMIIRVFSVVGFALLTGVSWPTAAFAQQGIRPFAGVRYTVDSNLFRTANDAEAIAQTGSTDTEETIVHYFAGIDIIVPVSLQRFTLSGQADLAQYENNSELNHTAIDGRGNWDWQVGNLWSGTAGVGYRLGLTEFNESNEPIQDLVSRETLGATARFQFLPDWAVLGGVGNDKTTHDVQASDALSQAANDNLKAARSRLDNTQTAYTGEIQYATTANTKVGVRTVFVEGEFDVDSTPNFEETEISGVVYWEATGKSHLEARFGQTERDVNATNVNFSGSTYRLTYKWLVTEKTNLEFSKWQETRLVDESTRFAVEDGFDISGLLNATAKLRFRGSYRLSTDEFQGGSGPNREDDITRTRFVAVYTPTPVFTINGSVVVKDRSSSEPAANFEATIYSIEAKLALR